MKTCSQNIRCWLFSKRPGLKPGWLANLFVVLHKPHMLVRQGSVWRNVDAIRHLSTRILPKKALTKNQKPTFSHNNWFSMEKTEFSKTTWISEMVSPSEWARAVPIRARMDLYGPILGPYHPGLNPGLYYYKNMLQEMNDPATLAAAFCCKLV